MSITSDIRSYADTALEQGKQVIDQAQTQLTDVTEQANGIVSKLTDTALDLNRTAIDNVSELRNKATAVFGDLLEQAEKSFDLEAIRSAVEPYLVQAKSYSQSITDLANDFYASVRNDKRVAKLVDTAGSVSGVVVVTVQQNVVKPVVSLTKRSSQPTVAQRSATKRTAPKPAAARPTTTRPAAKKAPAAPRTRKVTTTPATAKATARKSPAKKASS